MNIDLDMYQMTAVAVVVYYVGLRLKRRFNIFDQYCIPAPVIGGVLFSLLNLVMTTGGFWQLTLDTSLQGFFMTYVFYQHWLYGQLAYAERRRTQRFEAGSCLRRAYRYAEPCWYRTGLGF